MSERDNEAGVRWEEVISTELSATDFGILCLTPTNIKAPWLNFEAGALSKAIDKARVVPLLYRLAPADVWPPLSMFMMKPADEKGVLATIAAINRQMKDPLEPGALKGIFEAMWPRLQEKLESLGGVKGSGEGTPHRSERQLLEEILVLVRHSNNRGAQVRRTTITPEGLVERLRRIVGPNGSVELSDGSITLHFPRGVDDLTTNAMSMLRSYVIMARTMGIDVFGEIEPNEKRLLVVDERDGRFVFVTDRASLLAN